MRLPITCREPLLGSPSAKVRTFETRHPHYFFYKYYRFKFFGWARTAARKESVLTGNSDGQVCPHLIELGDARD